MKNDRIEHLHFAWVIASVMSVVLGVMLCTSGLVSAAQPDESAQAKAKLATVRARISELTNRLGSQLAQRDAMNARVRAAELLVTEKRTRLDALRTSEQAAEHRRAELRVEMARDEEGLRAERAALAAEVRAAYMIGPQEELKLLLRQNSPSAFGRTLTYHGYFAQQRSAKIQVIQDDENRLRQLVVQIDEQTQQLKSLQDEAARELADLQHARNERSDAVAALNKKVASGNQELANLKREEQAVESLVADLARVLQDFPVDATQSFDHMRGKLPWPVVGKVSARYQAPRATAASGMRWNGMMIDTSRGAKVRAAFFGRVIYADWLQGLGLLLIIGHSGGYMTLYGHAEVLYKSVGDWVAPGDVIAAMSDTEGSNPALYFEIREGRKTVDPKVWLRSQP
jgi:septal ring factor EnvC (AmiA/AmiB activator)